MAHTGINRPSGFQGGCRFPVIAGVRFLPRRPAYQRAAADAESTGAQDGRLFALANIILCGVVIAKLGWLSVLGVFLTYFFMSLMFPTIFALGIFGLGSQAKKKAAAFIVMSITGGALMPKLMGLLGDTFDMATSFWMPLGCFILIMTCRSRCVAENADMDSSRTWTVHGHGLSSTESRSRICQVRGHAPLTSRGYSACSPRLLRGRRILSELRSKACTVLNALRYTLLPLLQ